MIKIETKRLLLQNMHGFRLRQRDICILTACGCLGLSRGMDTDGFKDGATYDEIRDWIQEKYGIHVTNLNMAQIKRKNGIIERENYNQPKSEDSRQPETTPEKEKAITEALKHFNMI